MGVGDVACGVGWLWMLFDSHEEKKVSVTISVRLAVWSVECTGVSQALSKQFSQTCKKRKKKSQALRGGTSH